MIFEFDTYNKILNQYTESEQKAFEKDLNELMDNPAFRRFLWKLLEIGKPFQTSFTGNSVTFYNEGSKVIPLFIFNELMRLCPEKYLQMAREYNSLQLQRKKQLEKKLIKEGLNNE